MQNPQFYRRSNSQMGYSYSDFMKDSGISSALKSAETAISSKAKEVLPEKLYDAASSATEKAGAKLETQAKEALTDFAAKKITNILSFRSFTSFML